MQQNRRFDNPDYVFFVYLFVWFLSEPNQFINTVLAWHIIENWTKIKSFNMSKVCRKCTMQTLTHSANQVQVKYARLYVQENVLLKCGLTFYQEGKNGIGRSLNSSRPPTNSTKKWWDWVPDTNAAQAESLSYGQLQVEQREALKHQRDQVGNEECTWGQEVNICQVRHQTH